MNEQSKAARRRFSDGAFHARYFVGEGIDIGGKPDPLNQYCGLFARMTNVRVWDLADGDAQVMAGVAEGAYDFVHSSHCLEHMRDVRETLKNWIRIVRPGGFLVITVPDEDLYEQGRWPSPFNPDHKWSFTIHKNRSPMPRSINITDLLGDFSYLVEIERVVLVRDFFRDALAGQLDQTLTPVAECAIEFILRKRRAAEGSTVRRLPAQTVFDNLGALRDAVIPNTADDLPHGVVIPLATYAPWRAHEGFRQVFAAAKDHTLVDQYRAWGLWQLVEQTRSLAGDILEVGVWRGGTALVMARAVQSAGGGSRLYLADTFAGVVKVGAHDTQYQNGEHADTSVETVKALLASQGIEDYQLLPGIFPEQTGAAIDPVRLRLVHIDVDVYQSARDVFDWAWPRLVTGGVVVFDDYGFLRCAGVTRLVNELALRTDMLVIHNLNGQAVAVKITVIAPPAETSMHLPHCEDGGFNVSKRTRHGQMVYNRNDTHLGALLDTYGEFSEGEVEIFRQFVNNGDTVLDCGANIGTLSLPLARLVGESGKVIAFEPQRLQFQALCANMALNSVTNVVCRNAAVGDIAGVLILPPYDPYRKQSSGSICLEGYLNGESVLMATIDALDLDRCDFIKIDVEGMEEKVLRGARRTITRFKPVLYVENDRAEKSAGLLSFIRELGYEVTEHRPPLVSNNNYFGVPVNLWKGVVSLNLLCLPLGPTNT